MQKSQDTEKAVVGKMQQLSNELYRWSIPNFMFISVKNKFIESPIIKLDSCSFQLYVMTLVCNGFQGIIMHALNTNDNEHNAIVKCWIVKDGGRKSDDFSFKLCTAKPTEYGEEVSNDVIMTHSIRNSNFHYVKDGTLTVDCEILDEDVTMEKIREISRAKITTALEIPAFYEKLVGNKLCSDVIFVIDGKELYAHKMVLIASSTVFHDMLSTATKNGDKLIVDINDVNYEAFKELMRFIYAGKVNGLKTIAKDLLVLSHDFGIVRLKEICEQVLCNNINIDNALNYLRTADACDCDALKAEAITILTSNIEEVVARSEFGEFKNMKLVKDILREVVNANERVNCLKT